MQLTEHFSLEEMTYTSRKGIDNSPTPEILVTLTKTAEAMELVRTLLGNPIIINSAYRSPKLNKMLGSKDTSQHLKGEAVDFTCSGFGTPRQIVEKIIASDIKFDQIILEFDSWVHISFNDTPRGKALIIDSAGTRVFA